MAEGKVAQDVLDRLCRLSRAFGTHVEIEDNRGVINLA